MRTIEKFNEQNFFKQVIKHQHKDCTTLTDKALIKSTILSHRNSLNQQQPLILINKFERVKSRFSSRERPNTQISTR
jgi:hypothetical protein